MSNQNGAFGALVPLLVAMVTGLEAVQLKPRPFYQVDHVVIPKSEMCVIFPRVVTLTTGPVHSRRAVFPIPQLSVVLE